jgi:fumarate reductase flavoprotein subunit
MKFDFVSVGGGLAGLVAALRASQLGLQSAVIEVGHGNLYRCNSRLAGGVFHVSYQDVRASPDKLLEEMFLAGVLDSPQARAISNNAARALDWLRCNGAGFANFPQLKRGAWVMVPPRPLVSGFKNGASWIGRGPDLTLRALKKRLLELGGVFLQNTQGSELLTDQGACVGVRVQSDGKLIDVYSKSVAMCDGGFSANSALFKKYIGPQPNKVLQRGAATGRGDCLQMALQAGAATSGMNRFYGHLLSKDAFHNDDLTPYPQLDAVAAAGIVVNANGLRVLDEGLGGVYMANQLATFEDADETVAIIDSTIWNGPGRGGVIAPNPTLKNKGGTVHQAQTLTELANLCCIPAANLIETIENYNEALMVKGLNSLAPSRTETRAKAYPIQNPPYMAIPICSGITNTMGGLVIDGHGCVLTPEEKPIPGLYAAGATTGGLEGGATAHYVGGLIKASVFALLAAEHSASLQKKSQTT